MLDIDAAVAKLAEPMARLRASPMSKFTCRLSEHVTVTVNGCPERRVRGDRGRGGHPSDGKSCVVTVNVYGKTGRRYFDELPRAKEVVEIAQFLMPDLVAKVAADVMEE